MIGLYFIGRVIELIIGPKSFLYLYLSSAIVGALCYLSLHMDPSQGLYVEVNKAWGYAPLAQLLLPRYVPRAGRETLLHLSFWVKAQRLKATDPPPSITVRVCVRLCVCLSLCWRAPL